VACVQASALCGAELWWHDREGEGVKNPCDELQRLENQLGKAVTGNFRTIKLGVVMAEPGLRRAGSLLNNRSRRHVLRLMSFLKGTKQSPSQAATPPWDSAWSISASSPVGWTKSMYLPEDGQTKLGARICRVGGAGGEEGGIPAGTSVLDGTRTGRCRGGICGGVEERTELGPEKAHMGYYQEAYDAECAAIIARALDVAADRAKRRKLGRVPDAQATIKRMTHDEPGPATHEDG